MSYTRLVLPATMLLVAAVSGCGSARMITATPDGGVVSIPSNSNSWPSKYRDNADKLMSQKCPNGYDIIREEEVVVGQKTTTSAQTITPTGYTNNPPQTTVSTSTHAETEYRITFRAHQPAPFLRPSLPSAPVVASLPVLAPPPPGNRLPDRPIPVAGP